MYRKFTLFAATLSVFSLGLIGCQKEEAIPSGPPTKEAQEAAGNAAAKAQEAASTAMGAGKEAVAGATVVVTDPAKLMEALKADAGLATVKIQKNAKDELVMTGKVADQALKAKAEELVKAAGGTVKNAIIVGK